MEGTSDNRLYVTDGLLISLTVLRPECSRGAAKNCAIFPIASFWRLPIVALLTSKHEPIRSNDKRINTLGTLRDHVLLGHGGFYAFRDKPALERWLVGA